MVICGEIYILDHTYLKNGLVGGFDVEINRIRICIN